MLRMSNRAWNNVLIFTVIGLILIFNLDRFSDQSQATRKIVQDGEYILSMQINQVELERAGQVWRVDPNGIQPSEPMDSTSIESIINAWQSAFITPADIAFDQALFSNPNSLVVISLAGQSQPVVIGLFIIREQLFFVLEKQVFVLNSPSIQQLLEPIVTVKQ